MGSDDGGQELPERDEVSAEDAAEKAFVDGLLARGEATEPDENGELPPGATHEVVKDEAGRTTVRRRRFSAF